MKKKGICGIVSLVTLITCGCNSIEEASNVAEYASATAPEMNSEVPAVEKKYPTSLFPKSFAEVTLDSGKNVDFAASPLSLYVACSSLGKIAAQGETQDELFRAVSYTEQRNFSFCGTAMHNATPEERKRMRMSAADMNFHSLCEKMGLFATYSNPEWQNRTEPNTILMSNSLWLSNDFELTEDSSERDALCFHTKRIEMNDNGRTEINSFVDKMTRGLIPEFIKELDPATQVILINTLYFYADWVTQFDPAKSTEGDFFTSPLEPMKVTYMNNSGNYLGFDVDDYSAIILPYETIKIPESISKLEAEMVVILPKENVSNTDALEKYLSTNWDRWSYPKATMDYYKLQLPKFEINTELNLTKTLQDLGVKTAFSSKADFSNLSPMPLVISDVIQNVSIRVDEKGTEAAAATAIMLMRAMLPPEPKPFIVNRPFAFVIREANSNNILFMGTIAKPEAPKSK